MSLIENNYNTLFQMYLNLKDENELLKLTLATAEEDARQQRYMKIKAREQRDLLVQQMKGTRNYVTN